MTPGVQPRVQAPSTHATSPPCKKECGDSTFDNETSDASPLVKGCQTIIKNIEGDAGTWWKHLVVWKPHREILTLGTCAFGIEATAVNVKADLNFGGQDVIGMINTLVEKYGQGGKIGADGDLSCNGTVKNQPVRWGIYYT
ncbi:chitin-binding type 1 [Fusarium coicis]|nr:chitin-binding type 1 [Fusarium coicis]